MSQTLFTKVDYALSALVDDVATGRLGLPEIQRPFVWKNVKVRELFDSMYRGYPVGYLLFWATGVAAGTRQIGTDRKQVAASRVIVDGQQRLTSLYAVVRGQPVLREDYSTEAIEIAFNPLDERFEVADAAIRRNRAFIPSISAIWDPRTNLFQFANDYIAALKEVREVTPEETARAQNAIGRLHALLHFPFTALELSPGVEPEQVADVFVRINSEGKKLNNSDFILTLMSVFWDEGRHQLEDFCRAARQPGEGSPYNPFFQPAPDHLLRAAIAVGFRRARLASVYSILRGRSLDADSTIGRDEQFEALKVGQAEVLDIRAWHDFFDCVLLAGYRSGKMLTSHSALVFAYALYLIGRRRIGVEENRLRPAIARWLFMSNLTGRYTSSPESQMEFDLARLRQVSTADDFLGVVNDVCTSTLTSDFWSITLPGHLATPSARSPSMFGFFAALNILDARALFSARQVRDIVDATTRGSEEAFERRHLFPSSLLKKQGVGDYRDYNQIANYTIADWEDPALKANDPPSRYVPLLEARFDDATLREMYQHHALPSGWEKMAYDAFLKERRVMMAQTIRDGYDRLAGTARIGAQVPSTADLISSGESSAVEFKPGLRMNRHTGRPDPHVELMALKSIAGFLNAQGGTLIIGVGDDGAPAGLEFDAFPNEDKMGLHLVNLLRDRLGGQHAVNVTPHFDDHEGARVLVVACRSSRSPVFVKDGVAQRFYVRYGPSTQELSGHAAQDYIRQRF